MKNRNGQYTMIKSFEDLNCWKACRQLRIFITKQIIPCLPKYELYRLGDQILRSSRSTTANIAEGYGRFHYMDNAKYCSNSRGSCWETLDHLITANDEGFINEELLNQGRELVYSAVKLINGYMNYLQNAGKTKPISTHEELAEYNSIDFPNNY
jgi:four helix bundle protein